MEVPKLTYPQHSSSPVNFNHGTFGTTAGKRSDSHRHRSPGAIQVSSSQRSQQLQPESDRYPLNPSNSSWDDASVKAHHSFGQHEHAYHPPVNGSHQLVPDRFFRASTRTDPPPHRIIPFDFSSEDVDPQIPSPISSHNSFTVPSLGIDTRNAQTVPTTRFEETFNDLGGGAHNFFALPPVEAARKVRREISYLVKGLPKNPTEFDAASTLPTHNLTSLETRLAGLEVLDIRDEELTQKFASQLRNVRDRWIGRIQGWIVKLQADDPVLKRGDRSPQRYGFKRRSEDSTGSIKDSNMVPMGITTANSAFAVALSSVETISMQERLERGLIRWTESLPLFDIGPMCGASVHSLSGDEACKHDWPANKSDIDDGRPQIRNTHAIIQRLVDRRILSEKDQLQYENWLSALDAPL
ncbi:hypothetical protein BT69DRAFT_1351072 [Atractiella rhizophila]|nr:hypothetical protein BT69DRAFT_1351072 [Atractiella rhizophila]